MLLAAALPRLPMGAAAYFCEFDGATILDQVEDAPVVLYGWHAMEAVQVRPR